MAKKIGRPTIYTLKLAAELCFHLSTGLSLRTVCKMNGMPDGTTVFRWLQDDEEFRKQYARAKQEAADALAEEIIDISDEADSVIRKGAEKKSSAYAANQRLRVDTRKWIMAKMKPKKYGEKLDLTSDGKALPVPIYGGQSVKTATPKAKAPKK